MKIMWRLKFLVIALQLVDFCENFYIVRVIEHRVKRCIPISNCPYGHEILPCLVDFAKDTCASCSSGRVQPDHIQSTKDPNLTKCFKNQNVDKCRADVLKPSRENNAKVCRGVEFCKCNTDKFFFGDPCACQHRECDMDDTMLTNGTYAKCPAGTSRIKCGCGPSSEVPVDSRQNVTSGIETLPSTERDAMVTLDHSINTTQSQGVTTHGRGQKTDSTKTVSTNAFIAVVVVLAVFVAVCIVLLLILIRKHRKEVSSGFDSEEFPHCSPLSDDNSGSIQTYGEIVSVSVSNASTEGTDIITSGLECFRFRLTGQTTPVQRKSSQSKQVIVRKDSGVVDSGNEEP